MKHRFLLPLVALAALAAGCSSGGEETSSTTSSVPSISTTSTTSAVTTTTVEGTPDPASISIAVAFPTELTEPVAAGVARARQDFGVRPSLAPFDESADSPAELVRRLAEQRVEVVVAIGEDLGGAAAAIAEEFPDTRFTVVDAGSDIDTQSVAAVEFAVEEGSALVGAAAALVSGAQEIGFIGGVADIGVSEPFEAGFAFGAGLVSDDVDLQIAYLSSFPEFSGTNDPVGASEAAASMYADGADVVFLAGTDSEVGLFEAAAEASADSPDSVWAIGAEIDQYRANPDFRSVILTSMVKRFDVAVYRSVADALRPGVGLLPPMLGLAEDGVGYATSGGYLDGVIDELDAIRLQIVTGEIEVPDVPSR